MTGNFADFGIDIPSTGGDERQTTCPKCSGDRKKRSARCLSVNIEKGVWCCHHCGWAGSLSGGEDRYEPAWKPPPYRRPDPRPPLVLSQQAREWSYARGITDAVLVRNRIDSDRVYFPQLEAEAEALVFPYFRDGKLVNRKYRTIAGKHFRLETGCELVLCGLDDIAGEQLVWVEGELDKLALEVAGIRSCVSVPNGAPPPGSKPTASMFSFLEPDRERLEAVRRHVLAFDADAPGFALEAEFARRLGPGRCSRVRWPEGCKDANDVLRKHGVEELRWYVENAEAFPIEGTFSSVEMGAEVQALYEHGFQSGLGTGWPTLDRLYTVRPGELTVVTGIPSSGKSNWIDGLLVNLARLHGWSFALFSPENLPVPTHMAALAEKWAGKPFHRGPTPRMPPQELSEALAWIGEHFTWIQPGDESEWRIEKLLEIAGQLCLRRGIRGLVVDPWNELEHLRPPGMNETEYVSQALKRVRVFARSRGVHVWVVVHPAKLYRDNQGKYPVPTLYDCSGSANWRNKADNGICVWRDLANHDEPEVEIHIQKIRFRQVGRRGVCTLVYEPTCATYRDKSAS